MFVYENDNDNYKIKIGSIMKSIRKSRGLTQEQVAEMLGLASRYISDIERDKTKGSLDTLIKLCNVYDVTPTYVLKDYLTATEIDYDNDESLIGFYHLNDDEKEIVLKLIEFMNSKKYK